MVEKSVVISSIIDNIRRIFHAVNEHSKKAERETGITGPQLWAIKMIGELGSIRVSDLAGRMYLHPATVVGILDRLEARGLVIRERSKEDRRVVKVHLTEESRKIIAGAPPVAQNLLVNGLEELSGVKLNMLANSLDELVHILRAQKLPPQLILSPEVNVPGKRKKLQSSVNEVKIKAK